MMTALMIAIKLDHSQELQQVDFTAWTNRHLY